MAQAQPNLQIFIRPCFFTIIPTFALMVEDPNVVGNITLRVSSRIGIPVQNLRLALRGTTLQDGDHLSDYSIQDGDDIEIFLHGGGSRALRMGEERRGELGGDVKVSEVA